MRRVALAVATLLAGTSAVRAQGAKQAAQTQKAESVRETSDRMWTSCVAALKRREVPPCLDGDTEDAVLMTASAPTFVGKAAIGKHLDDFVASVSRLDKWTHTVESIDVAGDVAVERGTYVTAVIEKGKTQPSEGQSRYIILWKRQPNRKWLLWYEIAMPNAPTASK